MYFALKYNKQTNKICIHFEVCFLIRMCFKMCVKYKVKNNVNSKHIFEFNTHDNLLKHFKLIVLFNDIYYNSHKKNT